MRVYHTSHIVHLHVHRDDLPQKNIWRFVNKKLTLSAITIEIPIITWIAIFTTIEPLMTKNCSCLWKSVACWAYLYVGFVGIFCFFAIAKWWLSMPIGLTAALVIDVCLVLLYGAINHIWVKRVVPFKVILVFETLLIATLLTFFTGYIFLWHW